MDPERTIFVGNLSNSVTKDILEEIFVQLGPLYSVVLVEKPSGSFAFVEYVDDCSVIFACNMLQDLRLYGRPVVVKPRDKTKKAREWEDMKRKDNEDRRDSYDNRPKYQRRSSPGALNPYLTPPPPPPPLLPPAGPPGRYSQDYYGSNERVHSYLPQSWRSQEDRGTRSAPNNGRYQKQYKRNR